MRPALTSASARRRRRVPRLAAILGLALAISLLLAPAALANFLTPKSGGSPNADSIASLYKIILYLAIVVFVIVEGALVYSIYKFRAKKTKVAAQIHGNTRLEIGWTVAAAVILVVITVVTFVKLPSIINPPNTSANGLLSASLSRPSPPNGKSVTICVQGRQFIWRYVYGATCRNNAFNQKLPYSYQEMFAPANTTVVLVIQSTDVIHSWWVPSLGGKVDAVPGYTTYTWFKSPEERAVPRPVRPALRPQPRGDDRPRQRDGSGRLPGQAPAADRRDFPAERAGDAAAAHPPAERQPRPVSEPLGESVPDVDQ